VRDEVGPGYRISASRWERRVIGERTRTGLQDLQVQGRIVDRAGFDDATTLARISEERAQGPSYQEIARGLAHARYSLGVDWDRDGRETDGTEEGLKPTSNRLPGEASTTTQESRV
jgi:DNA invertase Pin-like site-specific DNA recombinase